ncbi:MAG: 23S rRNA methyltransferase [Candidatus Hadarchaeum yellowstonense]|uniref:Ribosomal RNA large subunit methyltransferase E n=1 Tax=Hadarchaeum yellowstonense TaxID=1776334 RepID=A0A147JYV6_HADYE|nr:MAG: 23S rRNA methyltransferase [Candidatus Hadarchaeum yellowstonense]
MGRRWQRERKREHFYRLAKLQNYRSRASFKLKQLNQRYGLLRRGDVVVDLGAAPGGWMQVALEEVGEEGFVLGVDVQRIEKFPQKNVATLVADITSPTAREKIREMLPRPADAVISDASPSISGVWDLDQARSVELVKAALEIAEAVLAPGGNFLAKVFQGAMMADFLELVRKRFDFVKVSKPLASRKGSAEVYVIAKGFRKSQ